MGTQADMDRTPEHEEERRGLEKELSELRREVIEARNLVIKTDNLLKNLHAEVKSVSKRNDQNYRRTWISSGAAYALFLASAVGLAALGARGSIAVEEGKTEAARTEAEKAQKYAEQMTAQLAQEKAEREQEHRASAQGLAAFRTLAESTGEKRLEGLSQLTAIDRERLSALEKQVLDERSRALKDEVGGAAFDRAKTLFRRGDMKAAVAEFERFLSLDPQGADRYEGEFLLGAAHYQLKDYEAAARHLEIFAANSKGQRNVDYGLFLLGQSHEQLGNDDRARQVYKRGVTEYPSGEFSSQMQRRLRALEQLAASAGSPAAPANPAVGGSGAQPAAAANP